ncbi:MAG: M28 family peptidase, partial [candidate division Zixibacteria bacterium]|nr:M28 family peptidase [candidate division Zixibacteria bacterium]
MKRLLLIAAFTVAVLSPSARSTAYVISPDSIYQHVAILAADSMEGRQVGEAGEWKSANYIISVFKQAGLEPKGDSGSYLQAFEFIKRIEFGPDNRLSVNGVPLQINEEYQPLEQSASKAFEFGELLSVGYGIVTQDSSYNDYKDLDVKGKPVLVRRYAPRAEGDSTGADTTFDRYSDLASKIITAQDHGATGVFFYTPETEDDTMMAMGVTHVTPKDIPIIFLRRSALQRLGLNISDPKIMSASGVTDLIPVRDTGYNVLGYVPGASDTVEIVGAHYDHIGWGGSSSRYRGEEKKIHNGADDNGSGTSALLELARHFGSRKSELHNSILFLAFSGEEAGTLGSGHYVRNWTVEKSKERLMINMDMIGRLASQEKGLAILGTGTCPEFKQYFDSAGLGGLKVVFNESGSGPSDHAAFYHDSIPCLFFFTGAHEDYHTPEDDVEKLDIPGIVTVADLVAGVLTHFDNRPGKLTFQRTRDDAGARPPHLAVTLGIMPDFVS